MTKARTDSSAEPLAQPGPPPLNAGVRRHLGQTLRRLYATSLTEPVSERMELLLERLDKSQR